MNWENVNLSDSYERDQNILSPFNFDTLLLEISTNLTEITEDTIRQYFNEQLKLKIEEAKEIFRDNLKNILTNALEYQNQDEEPGKPSPEEWKAIFTLMQDNETQPQEVTTKGPYYIDYFTDCLPPIFWTQDSVLCSEPYSHNASGAALYTGFYLKDQKYYGVITTKQHFKTLI
jgi:hypothetical protein